MMICKGHQLLVTFKFKLGLGGQCSLGRALTAQAMICLVIVGKDIELDAVGSQFEPCPYGRMRLHAGGTLVV